MANVPIAKRPRRKKKPGGKPKLIRRPPRPALRLTPTAWAKLLHLRDAGPTEIGGFGVSAEKDPLLVEDVALVRQRCDWGTVHFDDGAVADFFDEQVELGRRPEQFARIWVHTHPGHSADPSLTDEETFARVFGRCDWAVMFILARGGACYARLSFSAGPGGTIILPVEIAFEAAFGSTDALGWDLEYQRCVSAVQSPSANIFPGNNLDPWLRRSEDPDRLFWYDDYYRDLENGDGNHY